MSFEDLIRQIIREEINNAISEMQKKDELPPTLNRTEMMQLLRIGPTKAAELMSRPDFPVCREAGVFIPTDMLFEWIRRNTCWVKKYLKLLQSSNLLTQIKAGDLNETQSRNYQRSSL